MAKTTFSGPVLAGPNKDPVGATGAPPTSYPFNQGPVVLEQSMTLAGASGSTASVSATLYLPSASLGGGQANIIDIIVDTLTGFGATVGATLSVGATAGATTYASGVSMTSAGRTRPTFTAAQLAAMSNQSVTGTAAPQPGTVAATIAMSGTAPTGAPYAVVTIIYAQVPTSSDT
jgi:hypothetical protein